MDTGKTGLTQIKNRIARDTVIYLLGKGIEGIVGIFTISIYTRFFLPEVYSDYNYMTISINIAYVILLSWLTQSGTRYINMYASPKERALFFSTSFRVWSLVNLFVYAACCLSFLVVRAGSGGAGSVQYYLIAAAFMFTGYSTNLVLSGFLTAIRDIRLNLFLTVFSVTAKVILASIGVKLTALGSSTPAAVILSSILVDFTVILIITLKKKLYKIISLRIFSRMTFKKLFSYGVPIAGMGIAMSLLNLSDRYVIIFSLGKELGSVQNGIYVANYSIASAVFSALMVGMMRGVYPNILKNWKQNDRKMAMSLLTQGIRNYILIALPCAAGLGLLSGMVSGLLGEAYHSGSDVIIWVSAGMFFLGLTEYANKPWELASRTFRPFLNSLVCAVLNITVNLIFIPVYGYKTAAVTTALSYFIYFLISLLGGRRVLKYVIPAASIMRIALSCGVMGLAVYGLQHLLTLWQVNGMIILIASVCCGVAAYGLLLYLTGEIKNEFAQIRARASRLVSGRK